MTTFRLPEHHLPEVCSLCDYYDPKTGECLAAAALFPDCPLLERMLLPEMMPEVDSEENDG